MEGKQSEYDFLNFFNLYAIKNNITREEVIEFSDKISKINKSGWKQERNILITDKAVYNLKKKELKRRIDFKVIRGITLSKLSDEFIIHCNDIDYDYHYVSPRRKIIIEIIAKNYQSVNDSELKLFLMNIKSLHTFVTTKKEKEKDQNNSRMPNTGAISVNDFLFGENANINRSKTVPTAISKKTEFKNVKVNFDDFAIIKTIGRGSVGKVLLVRHTTSDEFYAMKMMRKDQLISEVIVDNILVEKKILMDGQCEFILNMSYFFQTPERIYFVTPFIKGGDLYHLLKTKGHLEERQIRFYSAQIAMAIQHLHDMGYAYRDLKPENVLIAEDGYIKLCDFGSAVKIKGTQKENSFAGSIEYASPEMILQEGHTVMCDWWSYGILLYEMFYGVTPFYDPDKNRMYELILSGGLSFPKQLVIREKMDDDKEKEKEVIKTLKVSDDAKNLITKLLEKDPGTRLGRKGLEEIKRHPFFGGISFDSLKAKKFKSLYKPVIQADNPTNNFEEEFLNMDVCESPVAEWIPEYQNWFDGFDEDGEEVEEEGHNSAPEDNNNNDDDE